MYCSTLALNALGHFNVCDCFTCLNRCVVEKAEVEVEESCQLTQLLVCFFATTLTLTLTEVEDPSRNRRLPTNTSDVMALFSARPTGRVCVVRERKEITHLDFQPYRTPIVTSTLSTMSTTSGSPTTAQPGVMVCIASHPTTRF